MQNYSGIYHDIQKFSQTWLEITYSAYVEKREKVGILKEIREKPEQTCKPLCIYFLAHLQVRRGSTFIDSEIKYRQTYYRER